jgi:hypothetical protein
MSFSIEMLLGYFAVYNERIWPMQLLGYIVALLALVPLFRQGKAWNRVVTGVLALIWLWLGLVFWMPAAGENAPLYVPTVLFIVQGVLFLIALARERIAYGRPERGVDMAIGLTFVTYALVGYPLVGLLVGHVYPYAVFPPLFPCPFIIFFFGVLFFAERVPRHLLIIPALWAATGILWSYLGMVEDIGMLIAGLVGVIGLVARERAARRAVAAIS